MLQRHHGKEKMEHLDDRSQELFAQYRAISQKLKKSVLNEFVVYIGVNQSECLSPLSFLSLHRRFLKKPNAREASIQFGMHATLWISN